jgi:hypothetical protein
MRQAIKVAWAAAVACTLLSACASYVATSGRVVVKDDTVSVEVRINERDRELIRDYYRGAKQSKKLPPGLAKKEKLPPGLAKRDTLPPGLQGEPLPTELEARLSPLPGAYARVKVGGDIVLMDKKTRVVFDVVYGLDN